VIIIVEIFKNITFPKFIASKIKNVLNNNPKEIDLTHHKSSNDFK
jgi:hypothetical protein